MNNIKLFKILKNKKVDFNIMSNFTNTKYIFYYKTITFKTSIN